MRKHPFGREVQSLRWWETTGQKGFGFILSRAENLLPQSHQNSMSLELALPGRQRLSHIEIRHRGNSGPYCSSLSAVTLFQRGPSGGCNGNCCPTVAPW